MRAHDEPQRTTTPPHRNPPHHRPTPPAGPAAAIIALHRQAGNTAVTRAIQRLQPHTDPDRATDHPRPVRHTTVHDVLRTPGTPISEPLRHDMEARLGADFSDVRLHTGALAERSARELGARAYTSGNHIVLGPGGTDRHTLAHELTHVIQQRTGPVTGTDNGHGLRVSDPGDPHEHAAETNARRVLAASLPAGPEGDADVVGSAGTAEAGTGLVVQRAEGAFQTNEVPLDDTTPEKIRTILEQITNNMLFYNVTFGSRENPTDWMANSDDETWPGTYRIYVGDILNNLRELDRLTLASLGRVSLDDDDRMASDTDDDRMMVDPDDGVTSDNDDRMMVDDDRELGEWRAENEEWIDQVRDTVYKELLFYAERARDFGYFLMRTYGDLWSRHDMSATERMSDLDYFREMSAANLASLEDDPSVRGTPALHSPRNAPQGGRATDDRVDPWVDLRHRLESALRRCVLRHYTRAKTLRALLGDQNTGTLKSKAVLDREDADVDHNSTQFDVEELANHGFVFFYIEQEGQPFRPTRFGDARITLPIGLLESGNGWAMLNDFSDREFPTLRADENGEMISYTRGADTDMIIQLRDEHIRARFPAVMSETHAVPEKSPEGRLKRSVYNLPAHVEALAQAARAFHQDAGHDSDRDLDETLLKLRETVVRLAEELSERKRASADASRYTRRVRIFRERGRMESDRVDYHADDQRRTTFPEPLRSNILVGGDVIPGLAQRCVVEIARIQRHQPDVAQRLMTKPDDELVRILLKDFLRPQAMLQKQVTFTLDQVEFP